jgi:predicted Zn-dependent protease with MMP-like domain
VGGLGEPDVFATAIDRAVQSLPRELRDAMSNVEIVVEDHSTRGETILGLYEGIPLTKRGIGYNAALPDKITIFRSPLERLYGHDRALLAERIRHTVLHEIAHHFGISDERLVELDRY